MENFYEVSTGPVSASDLIKMAKEFDFIQLLIVDLHGIPRAKVLPADSVDRLLTNGQTTVVNTMAFVIDGSTAAIPEHTSISFGNVILRPLIETTRSWPGQSLNSEFRFLQIFASPDWLNGEPITADSRQVALSQLKRLHDRGLEMFMGFECEFRLFKLQDDEEGEPVPAHEALNMFILPTLRQYDKFIAEVNKRTRALGFKFDSFYNEYAPGQLELAMAPEWGIKAIDDLVRLKIVIREVALDCGYRASFMTKSVAGQSGSGLHFNHSLWHLKDGKPSNDDAMYDKNDELKMSAFARHWTAGLLHHANALTAVWSPTVNCYRRLHKPWAPDYADWGVENRMASVRVRNSQKAIVVENRCPSSAANPYLILAGVIAGGLDGVDRKLPLVEQNSKEMGQLPQTLHQALDALKNDAVVCTAFGKQFVDWYDFIKVEELSLLKSVNVAVDKKEDFTKERKLYLDIV